MFEFLTKIKLLIDLANFVKNSKVLFIFFCITAFSFFLFFYGIKRINDNSIYTDNLQDEFIEKEVKSILRKCGNSHAIGISTVSTEIKTNYYAKFKEFWACDTKASKTCLINLLELDKYATDFNVDYKTYNHLLELSASEDVEKINLNNWEQLEEFETIKNIIKLSPNNLNYLWLTAVANIDKNIIYVLHMASWSENPCGDGRFLLGKFKKKLPKTKLI